MSAAVVQTPVEEAKALSVVAAKAPAEVSEPQFTDEHPFESLAIFIAISMAVAGTFVALLAMWIYAIRYSGVNFVRF